MIDDRLAYKIAQNIFRDGLECDAAARIIRRQLPLFFLKVRDQVKEDMAKRAEEGGWSYDKKKERDISR